MYLCWCIPAFTGIVSVVLSPKLSELWQQSLSRPHLWQAHSGLGFCVHKLSPQSFFPDCCMVDSLSLRF